MAQNITVEVIAVDKASQPLGVASQKAQAFGNTAATASTNAGKLNTTLGQTGTNAGKAGQAMGQVQQKTQQLGQAQTTTASSGRNMGVAMAGVATSMVGLATSVTALGNQYDSLKDTQLAIEKSADGVKKAKDRVTAATDAYNVALEKEDMREEDVLEKKNAMENAIEALSNKQAAHNDLVEDTNRAWKQFALQIAGTVLQSVGGFATAMSAIGPAGKAAGVGMTGASTGASKFLKVLGPIGIAIAAGTAAFLAIKNNTFGFRDALSDLGLKIGTAIPALKPLLDFLQQLGGFLGIAGDQSATLKSKFLETLNGIKTTATELLGDIVAGVQGFIQKFLEAFDLLGQGDIAGAFKIIKDQVIGAIMAIWDNATLQQWIKTFVDFVSNPSSWQQAFTGIVQALQGVIQFTETEIVPIVTSFATSIVDWVTDPQNWQDMWDGLVEGWTGIVEWASDMIEEWIMPFVDALIEWVTEPDNWADLWEGIVEGWEKMVDWAEENIVPWMEGLVKVLQEWAGKPENWADLAKKIMDTLSGAIKFTEEHVGPMISSIFTALTNLVPNEAEAKTAGENIVKTLSAAIHTAIDGAGAAISGYILGAIFGGGGGAGGGGGNPASGGFQIENEAVVDSWVTSVVAYMDKTFRGNVAGWQGIAGAIWDGLLIELNNAVQARGAEINQFVGHIISFLTGAWAQFQPQMLEWGGKIIDGIKQGVVNFAANLVATGTVIANSIGSAVLSTYTKLLQFGKDIIAKIKEGIVNAGADLVGVLTKPFEDAWAAISPIIDKIKNGLGTIFKYDPDKQVGDNPQGGTKFDMPPKPQTQSGMGGAPQITNVASLDQTGSAIQGAVTPLQQFVLQLGAAMQALDAFIMKVTEFQQTFYALWTQIAEFILVWGQTIWVTFLTSIGTLLVQWLTTWFTPFMDGFYTLMNQVGQFILEWSQTVWVMWLTNIGTLLVGFLEAWVIPFMDGFFELLNQIGQFILEWSETVWVTWLEQIGTLLVEWLEAWLLPFQEGFYEIMIQIGEFILEWTEQVWLKWLETMGELLTEFAEIFVVFRDGIIEGLEVMGEAWVEHADVILQSLTDAGEYLFQFAEGIVALRDGTIESTQEMAEAWQQMAEDFISSVEEMISGLEDLVEVIEDVESAAKSATSALNAMARAAEKAAAARAKVGGARYGGSWISGGKSGYQTGGSFIAMNETTFKGRRIAELNKWELVTVQPLSNPSDATDKNSKLFNAPIKIPTPAAMNSSNATGGGSGRRGVAGISVSGNLNATLVLPDGRVIARISNPYIMEGQDAEL